MFAVPPPPLRYVTWPKVQTFVQRQTPLLKSAIKDKENNQFDDEAFVTNQKSSMEILSLLTGCFSYRLGNKAWAPPNHTKTIPDYTHKTPSLFFFFSTEKEKTRMVHRCLVASYFPFRAPMGAIDSTCGRASLDLMRRIVVGLWESNFNCLRRDGGGEAEDGFRILQHIFTNFPNILFSKHQRTLPRKPWRV